MPSAGTAAASTPAAAGAPSAPEIAPPQDARRETASRDVLVPLSIVVVSAAISMMSLIQLGMSLTNSLIAGAVGGAVLMLVHKQFQKSAQIAQLKAELAQSRAQPQRPKSAAPHAAPTGALTTAATKGDVRTAGFGAPPPRLDIAHHQALSLSSAADHALPHPMMSGPPAGEMRDGLAADGSDPQPFGGAPAQRETGIPHSQYSPERMQVPSPATEPAADASSIERGPPHPEANRKHWSFRPRSDARDPSSPSGPSLGVAGSGRPGTTIEGDLELVQRKIKELADEVNATEALRAARPKRLANQDRPNNDRLASNALEDSIGALKAAASSMRTRQIPGEFVPALNMPPVAPSQSVKPDVPQQLGELVIPATAERIAGFDFAAEQAPEVRQSHVEPAPFAVHVPDFPSVYFPSDMAPKPALPPRAAAIARAVEDKSIEVFLAPIVTLAEHSVSHYEMAVDLRSAAGERLEANSDDFALIGGELDAQFDIARLNRAAALALRMEARDKDGSLLAEFMGSSLTSRAFLETFAHIYEARPAIAAQLVLTLPQRAVDELTPSAWQAVADMHAFGFRFALDRIEHLGTDFASLARSGFRFVKLNARALFEGVAAHDRFVPADEVYQRVTLAGLSIIANGISDATTQRGLLAAGVLLGQGPLFGNPRQLSLDGVVPSEQSAAA